MTETLHVMHVVLRLDVGGLERLIVDLVAEGCRHRQRVSVLCLEQPGTLASQAAAQGAHVISAGKRPGLCLTGSHAIRQVLRDMRPDVLHTHQVGALFYAGPEAHAVGIPLVVHTEHGNYIRTAQGYLQRQRVSWLWWWAARYARIFFCVSRDIAGELASRGIVPSGKLSVILNGIKTESFQKSFDRDFLRRSVGIPTESYVVGTVGRLSEVKQQDLLLRAFARLKTERPDARLLLVGDGPMRNALGVLSKRLDIQQSVHFVGYQPHPEEYLAMMDVFALTSRIEGLPLAVLEAWAAGLPVIASAVGGVPDLVEQRRTGLLFRSGDEGTLADLLREIVRDPGYGRCLGEAGRQQVLSRYNLSRMAEDYDRNYRALLRDASKVPANNTTKYLLQSAACWKPN